VTPWSDQIVSAVMMIFLNGNRTKEVQGGRVRSGAMEHGKHCAVKG
jgi:hypothetical protein